MEAGIARALERDPRIAYALVFGSVAREAAHAGSDLDVGVGLVAGASLSHHDIGDLTARLETAVGRTVDLVLLDTAPPGLAFRAFRDGRAVFERDHARLVARKARAILEYLDFQPTERLLAEGALRAAARGR
ncbi:MAG TPA: nucleotidyltransferase domain-containing protein [Vicinamibacteria bacterium]|nr:nucleotidyltransferase domain-containing protein [Vicinamibacteria bacterium]